MKRNILRISLLTLVVTIVSTGFSSTKKVDLSYYEFKDEAVCFDVPTEDQVILTNSKQRFELYLGKTYVGFKEAVGWKESQGRYSVINEYGYMGKYQFGKATLKMIGIYNTQDFMNDTRLQELAFDAYTSRNKWILRKDIKRYVGKRIDGVKITESGILAAAHLAGAGNVKKYLRSGGAVEFHDAFGTSIRHYLKKFSGYDTSFVTADNRASVLL